MRGTGVATALAILLLPAVVCGQEPVRGFDQLNTRLKVGDRIFVTDTTGQEHQGKVLEMSPAALILDTRVTFPAADVQLVEERERDTLKNGALIGLATGAGLAGGLIALACTTEYCTDNDAPYMALAIGVYGGLGAAIGTGIDALIPGKKRVVYRAAEGRPGARVSVAPLITPRAKALAITLSF